VEHEVEGRSFHSLSLSSSSQGTKQALCLFPSLPSRLEMAMGTHWVGYHSAHPRTRVLKKSPYPSPYPRGQ